MATKTAEIRKGNKNGCYCLQNIPTQFYFLEYWKVFNKERNMSRIREITTQYGTY